MSSADRTEAAPVDAAPTALVTGGGKRIGRAICLALARGGYDVAVHHRGSAEDAQAVAREIQGLGRRAAPVQADLADGDQVQTLVVRARDRMGPLSLLVNCASRFEDDRIGGLTLTGWATHMDTNLRAPVMLAQAFATQLEPHMADAEASIVNILDQRVLRPNPQFFSYTLSKCALWTATRTMAQALAPRIRVNAVGPGPTLASVHQNTDEFAAEVAAILLKRAADPEAIADAVLYLARARAVTGQMIAVDGGQHLGWRTPDILED